MIDCMIEKRWKNERTRVCKETERGTNNQGVKEHISKGNAVKAREGSCIK